MMMLNTFKQGDRVRLFERPGAPIGTIMEASITLGIKRDDGVKANYHRELWFEFPRHVEHDRAFQVGDWVRYEGIVENPIASLEGHIGTITEAHVDSARVRFPGITGIFLTGNLVKIAPPEEESERDGVAAYPGAPKTTTIEHPEYGRVEGVVLKPGYRSTWEKNGAEYFRDRGWKEVRPTRWEPVEVRIGVRGDHTTLDVADRVLHLPLGYRWKTVEIEREEEA